MTQVPMFCPMMMGMAAPKVTAPVTLRPWRIPTEAEEDWMMPVSTAPASTPRTGFCRERNRLRNHASSSRKPMAPDIRSMPVMSTMKPSSTMPAPFRLSFRPAMYRRMPMTPSRGARVVGLKICTRKLSPSRLARERIHAVTVVPTLAPMMMPMACRSTMIPELTKPTTITVVAEEDWITAVTARPSRKPLMGVSLIRARIVWSLPPAWRSSALPMTSIPKRNSARPPSSEITWRIYPVVVIRNYLSFFTNYSTAFYTSLSYQPCPEHATPLS